MIFRFTVDIQTDFFDGIEDLIYDAVMLLFTVKMVEST